MHDVPRVRAAPAPRSGCRDSRCSSSPGWTVVGPGPQQRLADLPDHPPLAHRRGPLQRLHRAVPGAPLHRHQRQVDRDHLAVLPADPPGLERDVTVGGEREPGRPGEAHRPAGGHQRHRQVPAGSGQHDPGHHRQRQPGQRGHQQRGVVLAGGAAEQRQAFARHREPPQPPGEELRGRALPGQLRVQPVQGRTQRRRGRQQLVDEQQHPGTGERADRQGGESGPVHSSSPPDGRVGHSSARRAASNRNPGPRRGERWSPVRKRCCGGGWLIERTQATVAKNAPRVPPGSPDRAGSRTRSSGRRAPAAAPPARRRPS